MKILFRLSKEIEDFTTEKQAKDFFRTLDIENDNYFYNNRHIRAIDKGDVIYFAYDSRIIAKGIFTGLKIERNEYFNLGYKLNDIEIIENSARLNAKIVGTRSIRYLKNKTLENEVMRVLEIGIPQIANEINIRSKNYKVGNLQNIRKEINGLKRLASKHIFASKTITEEWAFHTGGRTELQFNIGHEIIDKKSFVRVGVAFSLELSMSLTGIEPLIPKIALFNDYIQNNADEYADMKMWHYASKRSSQYQPTYIPASLVKKNVFIFLGIRQPMDAIDYDLALICMDRLLPLYLFIERESNKIQKPWEFKFNPGNIQKKSSTKASSVEKMLDITLRHNDIQKALYDELVSEYGEDNVGTEIQSGCCNSVDVIVQHDDKYSFYEIKTAHTAKSCIRQAIGQLLEYSYWPNNKEASSLIVVGEADFDDEAKKYLETLKDKFTLPLDYKSVKIV